VTQHRQNGQDFTDSYHLSERIQLLSRRSPSQLLSAVQLVKASPSGIATVVCWNVLLHECFFHAKFKLAYEVWMDMKRRGVRPSARSFGTFFHGCGGMKGGPDGVDGLARVRTVWAQWLVHAEKVLHRAEEARAAGGGGRRRRGAAGEAEPVAVAEAETTDGPEDITNLPSNNFLAFLAKTNQVSLLLETFYSMPDSGPLAPDMVTYSIVLAALRPLVSAPSAAPADAAAHFAAALQAWDRLASSAHLQPDAETVSLLISICRASLVPQDQLLGLKLAEDWFGLLPPSEAHKLAAPGLAEPKVAMDSAALSNVLTLVTKLQKHNLVVEWFDQVRDHPERFGDVVEHWQCDLVLVALGFKKDARAAEDLVDWMIRAKLIQLQPTLATWTNALQVCWRAADLARACRLLGRMTGKPILSATSSAESNGDEATTDVQPTTSPSHHTEIFAPDARTVSTLLQTALATRDRGNIARTLTIIDSLGFGRQAYNLDLPQHDADADADADATHEERRPSPRRKKQDCDPHRFFWQFKLAEVAERALERVLQGGEGHLTSDRRRELAGWRRTVIEWLEAKEDVGKESRQGSTDGEESMRKRRERLGMPLGRSALQGRERRWQGHGQGEKGEGEGEGAEKRLNRKQRRMLARGDPIEPKQVVKEETEQVDDGFVVSSRDTDRSQEGFRGRRFESRPPRSFQRRDDNRAPRRFDRNDDRAPRQFGQDDYTDRAPHRFSQGRDGPPRRYSQSREEPPHQNSARPGRRFDDFDDRRREDRGGGSRQRGWDD